MFLGYRTCGPITYCRGVASVVRPSVVRHPNFFLNSRIFLKICTKILKNILRRWFFVLGNFHFWQNGGHFCRKTSDFGLCRSISQNLFKEFFSILAYLLLMTRPFCSMSAVLIECSKWVAWPDFGPKTCNFRLCWSQSQSHNYGHLFISQYLFENFFLVEHMSSL